MLFKKVIYFLEFIILGIFFLLKSELSFAVAVSIYNYPSIINEDSFAIVASVSGATAGTNYLRIDLFKDGLQSYFGETFNGNDWYGSSIYSQYFPIAIQNGITWGGTLQGRIGSPTQTQYDGQGTYKMRLRRYTSGGGSTASEANNSAVAISINIPTPTPTPSTTPTSSSSPTLKPALTTTSTPTPTPKPTPSLVPIPTKVFVDFVKDATSESEILGTKSAKPSSVETPKSEVKTLGESENIFHKVFIILGILTIITSVVILIRQKWIKH